MFCCVARSLLTVTSPPQLLQPQGTLLASLQQSLSPPSPEMAKLLASLVLFLLLEAIPPPTNLAKPLLGFSCGGSGRRVRRENERERRRMERRE